ncbi:MAG: GTPase Era [Chitinophagaceae bacterium]|nr:MAG: GTPase Era [Chitinophagaceae bacterium]
MESVKAEEFKAGYINVIGKPNVGKSTFLNAILGEKLAITTAKAQTTRHRILGIITKDEYQAIFSDTPGFISDPKYGMQDAMVSTVREVLKDGDVFILIVDPKTNAEHLTDIIKALNETTKKVFLMINKIDTINAEQLEILRQKWQEIVKDGEVLEISALKGFDKESLLKKIVQHLPVNPPYFPDDYYTDRSERFLVSEIIREKIMMLYEEEVPYSVEVVIHSFKEDEKLFRIAADIYVNRKTQKPILIGKGGEKIKKVGVESRKEIEAMLGKQVFLETHVKVRENWRNDAGWLRRFGYKK